MRKIIFAMLAMFLFSGNLYAQSAEFTRSFYDWYLKRDIRHNMDDVLRYKKEALSPNLYIALKADRDAQLRSPHELVGLDFDPFLNAQDVAQKYEVGAAVAKGGTYWVPVYGLWGGKKSEKPDVNAEVKCEAGVCRFVNFHYDSPDDPQNENLISILRAMKKNRGKH